jgi:hypothetical protein
MKMRNIILTLLLLLPILTGCTKEDYRNCPAGLYIAFETINPKQSYPDEVQNLSLYFFDPQTGDLAEEFHYLREELRETDRAALVPQIPAATYRVVAVINDGIDTQTTGAENYATLKTMLNEQTVDYKPVNFFTGEKEITVNVNTTKSIPVETMPVIKHNKNIHLNIVYDGYVAQPDVTFTSWIEGSDACYEYATQQNTSLARFTPWEVQLNDDGMPSRFSLSTMRFVRESDLTLHLQETANTRTVSAHYIFNLTDELAGIIDESNPDNEYLYDTDEEIEFEDEFEITIKIGKDNIAIAVGVDRWDTIGGGVEL